MAAPRLELFYFNECPFCQMVLRSIEKLKVKVEYQNILEQRENLQRLMADTGRRTTPCLYIDNKPLFESKDIMEWLESNIDKLDKA